MMSGAAIQEVSRQAARKASREKAYPLIVEQEDLAIYEMSGLDAVIDRLRFPFIGDWRPRGYTPTANLYFVDSSGFGAPGEPALTSEEFFKKLRAGYAYAIVEAGQFQVYVREFTVRR